MGITGTFPSDAFKLFSFLDVVDVAGNQMYGELMPTTFTDMNHLVSVKASKNNFTGLVPTSLLQGRNIRTVTIPANQFTGMNVLNDFSKDLKSFSVTDNRLSGKIEINTDDINRLNSLSFIRLDGNSFTGTIPPELFQLHYLKYATMSNNALSGQVPSTVGLASLDQLTLSKNKLTGPLPDELYNCTLLGALELEGNQLNGTISPLIGNLHEFLLVMSLANNQFEGTVPTEFGLLTLLQTLTVRGNAFTEAIPSEMCVLRESFLDIVEADCLMENEIVEIQCPTGCCTTCCNPSGSECQAM